MSRRLLLTGASGYIGRRMVPMAVAEGYEVHAVTRRPRPGLAAGASWHVVDLLDARAASDLVEELRPELLVHLAWYAEHGLYWESPVNLRWLEATLKLLEAFGQTGGLRAVCAGTCAEYTWTQSPCVEGVTPLEPVTLYGISKDATHRVAAGLAERAQFQLAWGRPFLLYGPGEDERRLIPHVARAVLEGREAQVTDGLAVRDFLHVDDVARAFLAVLKSSLTGPVNISSGVGVMLRDVIERVAQVAGNPGLVRLGAVPSRSGDPPELVGCARRLRDEARFVPRVQLDQGLAETVDWWRTCLKARERSTP